jgi:polar amino acid transport system substrate-binding protein
MCVRGEWDIAFVARDPVRGKAIDQTRPYVLIEGTCLVPGVSPIKSNDEVDAIGTRVSHALVEHGILGATVATV